jgi:hypothetical protein
MTIKKIPQNIAESMVSKKIWSAACPVKIENLRLLEIQYHNYDSQTLVGQMIVHEDISKKALGIFQELFERKFPIYKISLIDEYNGSDELSMEANNSSCFNYRTILGTDKLSIHSYGRAIDINPRENPYITHSGKVLPSHSHPFLDRSNIRKGMVEPIVDVFLKEGFEWGGNWSETKDYHHFQITQ